MLTIHTALKVYVYLDRVIHDFLKSKPVVLQSLSKINY